MAGQEDNNLAIDGIDDDEVLLNDDTFLAAIASVEAQHLGRMTNILSYNGSRICGEGADSQIAGKRSAFWDGQNNGYGSAREVSRGETVSTYSEDETRKRIRTEEDMRSGWHSNNSGQEHAERLVSVRDRDQPEGEYMAALRGSNSELWQTSGGGRGIATTSAELPNRAGASGGNFKGGGGSSGGCFKCGMEGHWSKDCPGGGKVSNSFTKPAGGEGQGDPNFPEKLCSCGAGVCPVFTASTEKNMGRSFYRCPLRKDEGQCPFFEWCDGGGQSGPTERSNFQQDFSQQPPLECKCGGGLCTVLTAKTEKNLGRQFYKCPAQQSCSFFQWCDEMGRDAGGNSSTSSTRATNFTGNSASPLPAGGSGGCFKCGQGGHWSRDCPNQQTQQQQYSSSVSSQSHSYSNARAPTGNTGNCYKCGGQGHWSTSCPNAGGPNFSKPSGGGTASGGSCYKCGDPGHWANRCPVTQGGQRS